MPFMQGDLAILSAEKYDDGVSFGTVARQLTRKSAQQIPSRTDDNASTRKRSRAQTSGGGEGDEEEKKRARGRPRLDTKDETTADRRRTQIRLAQRAYRNRKENAIQSLEKRVQDLRETNEEMSNAFMKLHDFALSQGLLERAPEFGRQLRVTTERFLTLARKSSEDGGRDDDRSNTAENESDGQGGRNTSQQSSGHKSASPEVVDRPAPIEEPNSRPAALYGGFIVTHDPMTEPEFMDSTLAASFADPPGPPKQSLDYEIVTYPTLDNASFPMGPTPDPLFQGFMEPSPYPGIRTPGTFSTHEITFGRRLQRTAVERALALISMPNPDPQRFARVFGFCMLFEPLESIHRRLRAAVNRTKQEALHYWQYPFVHLGGAGTHFENVPVDNTRPMGNQGSLDILKPKHNTGFSTGPFNPEVTEARDNMLDARLRMVVPGFQGEFYDCDEIEFYLHQRGVTIPATADFVNVEVDMADFDDTEGRSAGVGAPSGLFGPSSSDLAALAGLHGLDTANAFASADSGLGTSIGPSTSTTVSVSVSPGPSSGDAAISMPDGTDSSSNPWPLGGVHSEESLLPTTTAGMAFTQAGSSSLFLTTSAGEFAAADGLLAFSGLVESSPSASSMARKKALLLDVNVFVHELVERATCLGRTPGFRPKDVNAAFWIATRNPL